MSTAHDQLASWLELTVLMLGEAECESSHDNPDNAVCTGVVVARARATCEKEPAVILCSAAYQYVLRSIAGGVASCRGCGWPCAACWRVALI